MTTTKELFLSELFDYTNTTNPFSFFIPAYQRGYRWTGTQVEELIDDIISFAKTNANNNKRYCIQPIVVKKRFFQNEDCPCRAQCQGNCCNCWELVDGQQRLTALWLLYIFKYVNLITDGEQPTSPYNFFFEEKCSFTGLFQQILSQIKDSPEVRQLESFIKQNVTSVDEYYLLQSLEYIYNRPKKEQIRSIFESGTWERVFFIQYELDENNTDTIGRFIDVNAKSVYLTSSELIKAVIISKAGNLKDRVTYEWEEYEVKLNKNDFWSFICNEEMSENEKHYATRLDYIFEIWCSQKEIEVDKSDAHDLFRKVNEEFITGRISVSTFWNDIRVIIETLEDWFYDNNYYHLIGCALILNKYNKENEQALITEFYDHYTKKTKNEFKGEVIKKIKDIGIGQNIDDEVVLKDYIDSLSYSNSEDRIKIKKLLLIYNIALLVNSKNTDMRFSFNAYKNRKWDIEHINPQTPFVEYTANEISVWLNSCLEYVDENLKSEINNVLSTKDLNCINQSVIQKIEDYFKVPCKDSFKPMLTDNERDKALLDKWIVENEHFFIESEKTKIKAKSANQYDIVSEIISNMPEYSIDSIFNLVLLDATINRDYKNKPYPAKRDIIIKYEYALGDNKRIFTPLGTKNIFFKEYRNAKQLMVWSVADMSAYRQSLHDTIIKLLLNISGE